MERQQLNITSEIAPLKAVIMHTPGSEVETMTPENARGSLYSDILNRPLALEEFTGYKQLVAKFATVYEVHELLTEILKDVDIKASVIEDVCELEKIAWLREEFFDMKPSELARVMVEGYAMRKDSLTKFLSPERFSLLPLPNFFFTRDAATIIFDDVFVGKMANRVREREAVLMQAIFENHPRFGLDTVSGYKLNNLPANLRFEGGDILVVRHDILLVGMSERTSSQGIDFLINYLKFKRKDLHVIVQELPSSPESFIHLDMVFTLLDDETCIVYEPLILHNTRYQTVYLRVEDGETRQIETVGSILEVLRKLKMPLKPLYCGGRNDRMVQDREQWQSGANFFALSPGVVVGYSRNQATLDELHKNGFDIVEAKDVVNSETLIKPGGRTAITIQGAELSRGGGGARCMTLPLNRGTNGLGFV